MENQILNVKEVAKYLNCSVSNIRMLVKNKSIPHFRLGTKINFSKNAINQWIQIQENFNSNQMSDYSRIKSIK